MKHLVAALLLCSTALADGPSIVGSPSLRVKVGNPPWVLLTVKDAPPDAVQTWSGEIGPGKVAVELKDGLAVAASKAGTYGFRCVVQTPSAGLDPIQILDVTLLVETSDGVIPPPPPPPVVEDFATKVTKAVAATPKEAHEGLGQVAGFYGQVADHIKNGILTKPEQVTATTNAMTVVVSPEWGAIDTAVVQPHLKTLTLATAADYEPVWRQIAAAVKAGLTDIPPPDVDPAPIPVSSLHVLIIEEKDDRSNLPASQVNIFTSTSLRKWLTENKAQWRMFDDDVDQSLLEKKWKDGMGRARTALPWIVISNGSNGYEGALPKTEADLIQILEKYK